MRNIYQYGIGLLIFISANFNLQGQGATTIGFASKFISVPEDIGSVTVAIVVANPAPADAEVIWKGSPFSTAGMADINFENQMLSVNSAVGTNYSITIPIIDDAILEQDEYFVLSLENITGATLKGSPYITIYIKDNDRQAPIPTNDVQLGFVSSFDPGTSTAEIVMHDPASQRLFIVSSVQDRLDIADFSNPANIQLIKSVDMTPYGGITSVATKGGIVAVASPALNEVEDGSVVFLDIDGNYITKVTVGALPDMIAFTPDGHFILTANEGQPDNTYSNDPEGSVSIIDISGGIISLSQANVKTLTFQSFNPNESLLIENGVRKLKLSSTLSRDLEPEYITISPDSKKAWVTLQENNAIAELDLDSKTFTSIWAMGTKDYSTFGNGFDASDNSGVVHISNYPVKAFYVPDGIANYNVAGQTFLVTANEGDEKENAALNERTTVGAATLDPIAFPNAAVLKESHNLGRLRISNLFGDNDNDGDYDELFVVGSRSFSIWNADSKSLVFDSGDDFEMITANDPSVSAIFNADNENNNFKARSRAKGPEPEGVTIADINGRTYAFIALERVGGIMVYDVTDPNDVEFVNYKNSRSTSTFSGDHGPEGIIYVSGEVSPDENPYIIVANELSGSLSVFSVFATSEKLTVPKATMTIKPNPVSDYLQLNFNQEGRKEIRIFNQNGYLKDIISTYEQALQVDVRNYHNGAYILQLNTVTGISISRFIKK